MQGRRKALQGRQKQLLVQQSNLLTTTQNKHLKIHNDRHSFSKYQKAIALMCAFMETINLVLQA
ncbi:MAG: hypothetical protein RMX35_27950 [Nostoc sp. DcaGUA01]|nr:hypothetical protein [Nostoc sp. DcaGUA01]